MNPNSTSGSDYRSPDNEGGNIPQISHITFFFCPNTQPASISGYKYNSVTNAKLAGWTIQLWNADETTFLQSTTTDTNGNYTFSNLTPDTYVVKELQQSGWTQTHPANNAGHTVTVAGDGAQTGFNFGNAPQQIVLLGSISGYKYNSATETNAKLANWTIQLYAANGTTLQQSTTTDTNGNYTFSNLAPGTYVVKELQQSGWTQTHPANNAGHTVIVEYGAAKSGYAFGNTQEPEDEIIIILTPEDPLSGEQPTEIEVEPETPMGEGELPRTSGSITLMIALGAAITGGFLIRRKRR